MSDKPMSFPNHMRGVIESRECRGCHALPGASCIEPSRRAVSTTVSFDDGDRDLPAIAVEFDNPLGRSPALWRVVYQTFCYERVYDHFESHRPAIPNIHYVWIEPDYVSMSRGGTSRTAACTCGWKGPERGTLALAADDALMHEHDAKLEARARALGVHPSRLKPHDGPGVCAICGVSPDEEHELATHEANAAATGG